MGHNLPLHKYYSKIYRKYDLVNRLFTFGKDNTWRKETVRYCLKQKPEKVLDVCCGTGDLAIELKLQSNNDLYVTGYDFNENMLSIAKKKADRSWLSIEFIQGDVAHMNFSDSTFDAITIGFGFRNLTYKNSNSDKHLNELNRVVKSGGHIYILETSKPANSIISFAFNIYLKLFLIPVGGIVSGSWTAYRYLAKSTSEFFNPEEIKKMLLKSGFKVLFSKKYFFGAANLVIAEKV
ncbi:MAG: ubiquinone/menaquinone biosynthesis methyltransferase [Bacteroidales bacterium]|nr:ubiquinone/menaquinone biosynthesis methyltransferase [Bacteroidales bacterium]